MLEYKRSESKFEKKRKKKNSNKGSEIKVKNI